MELDHALKSDLQPPAMTNRTVEYLQTFSCPLLQAGCRHQTSAVHVRHAGCRDGWMIIDEHANVACSTCKPQDFKPATCWYFTCQDDLHCLAWLPAANPQATLRIIDACLTFADSYRQSIFDYWFGDDKSAWYRQLKTSLLGLLQKQAKDEAADTKETRRTLQPRPSPKAESKPDYMLSCLPDIGGSASRFDPVRDLNPRPKLIFDQAAFDQNYWHLMAECEHLLAMLGVPVDNMFAQHLRIKPVTVADACANIRQFVENLTEITDKFFEVKLDKPQCKRLTDAEKKFWEDLIFEIDDSSQSGRLCKDLLHVVLNRLSQGKFSRLPAPMEKAIENYRKQTEHVERCSAFNGEPGNFERREPEERDNRFL